MELSYYEHAAGRWREAVRRRSLFVAVALSFVALAIAAWAQQPTRVPVVGVLMTSIGPDDPLLQALRKGLRELGYVEDQNIRFEYRSAQGQPDRLPRLADELIRLNVDVIVAGNERTTRAAEKTTSTIPIVALVYEHDPVAAGLIDSFNRPGGNITGIFTRNSELAGKRLELLKEALPGLSRVAIFWDSFGTLERDEIMRAARSLSIQVQPVELQAPYDFETALKTAKQKKARAVMVTGSPVFYANRARIAALAVENGLPISSWDPGGLISYSADLRDAYFRLAYFIDRLLRGAKPSGKPQGQTRFSTNPGSRNGVLFLACLK